MNTKTLSTLKSKKKNSPKHLEFITDKKGNKTKIILPIEEYYEIMEDLHDLAVVAERKNEKSIPIDDVIKEFKKNGRL